MRCNLLDGKKMCGGFPISLESFSEKIHPNDSNIFAKYFRSILENISDVYNFLHPCRRCCISCTACVIVCISKKISKMLRKKFRKDI